MTLSANPGAYNIDRLRWQCRRGMLELDYLLGDFLDHRFGALSPAQQADFVRLLGEADQDLQRWLVGGEPAPDAAYRRLIEIWFVPDQPAPSGR